MSKRSGKRLARLKALEVLPTPESLARAFAEIEKPISLENLTK
jgi:hypothetical protein